MKKLLSIIIFSLLLSGNVYAETIYCKVDTTFICSSTECKQTKSEIFVNLDTERNTYQRGDSKGIDTYDMNMYKSGNFVTAEVATWDTAEGGTSAFGSPCIARSRET